MRPFGRRQFTLPAGMLAAVTLAVPRRLCAAAVDPALLAAIASPSRSQDNVARDRYRHPAAVLAFVGLRDDATVLEIEPGRGYWTEILAPYLRARGRYIAALPPPTGAESAAMARRFTELLRRDPALYGGVALTSLGGKAPLAPPESIDLVLSFRNLHDWMADGTATARLRAIQMVLKPGGALGIEDHRAPTTQPQDPKARSGYVREDYARALIESVGFKLAAVSQVGDNPHDTKNYPKGVWTLPPTLALGGIDRAKYLAIGESDRWTMKFVKAR